MLGCGVWIIALGARLLQLPNESIFNAVFALLLLWRADCDSSTWASLCCDASDAPLRWCWWPLRVWHPGFINTPATSPPEISDPAKLGLVHGRDEARMSRLLSWNPKQRICPWPGPSNISIWRRERTQYKVWWMGAEKQPRIQMSAAILPAPFVTLNVSKSTKIEYKWTDVSAPALLHKGKRRSIFRPVFLLQESLHSHACKSYHIRHPGESTHTRLALAEQLIERRVTSQGELEQVCLMSCFTPHWWGLSTWQITAAQNFRPILGQPQGRHWKHGIPGILNLTAALVSVGQRRSPKLHAQASVWLHHLRIRIRILLLVSMGNSVRYSSQPAKDGYK